MISGGIRCLCSPTPLAAACTVVTSACKREQESLDRERLLMTAGAEVEASPEEQALADITYTSMKVVVRQLSIRRVSAHRH